MFITSDGQPRWNGDDFDHRWHETSCSRPQLPLSTLHAKWWRASSKLTNDDETPHPLPTGVQTLPETAGRGGGTTAQRTAIATDNRRHFVTLCYRRLRLQTATTPPTTATPNGPHLCPDDDRAYSNISKRRARLPLLRRGLQKVAAATASSDEQPQQPLPQHTAAQQKIGDLPKQAEPRMQAAMAYAQQNPGLLGVGGEDGQQILHLAQGAYRPIKGSNLGTLLRYHFVGRHQQQQPRSSSTTTPRTSVAKAPPGYKTFVNNAHDDLQMWRLLFPDEKAVGSDSASTVGGQPRRHQPLRGQKKTGAGRFSLSLLQPKQHAYKSVQKTSIMVIGGSNVVARSLTVESLLDPIYKDERSPACFTSVEPLLREAKRRHPTPVLRARRSPATWRANVSTPFTDKCDDASAVCQHWPPDYTPTGKRTWPISNVSVYVQPVKSKRSDDMITALKRTFARCGYTPWRLLTDKGREFTASAVQRYLRDEAEVRHHCMETSPLWHAGMAERANRSIKERLYRYFTHRGTQCWTRVIQRIVSSLNASPNSSIFGMRPNEVCFENAESLRQRIADRAEAERSGRASQHPRFRPGDQVRIERARGAFRKGYLPRFTDEVFTVDRVCTGRRPITYKLRDRDGEPITGLFYANDMCLVLLPPSLDDSSSSSDQRKTRKRLPDDSDNNKVYAIERILERRYRKDGTECCLVKWKGYSTRHNSWIPAHTII
ncbi:hypothetical protein niasHT_019952 [Heterodera trifolii]|uniref:Uncharacterized protein n=1 Tax=Heterodera trifolii TaxID=157864 RepID=A0ABD2LH48_9BILA